ncbi:hypothetical protein [Luteimicrobium sp. DT211]|uniref:hypothetical protein n=1 Tax=Luteimicrobium sp. DT211 TaxID=3393412 RepID=UPI003CEC6377
MTLSARPPSALLGGDEVTLLVRATSQWGGPAHASEGLARAMGFEDTSAMLVELAALGRALRTDTPLEPIEWARVLVATEIAFASDLFGAGTEWRTMTGETDEATIRTLRAIQRKLGPVLRGFYGGRASLLAGTTGSELDEGKR